MRQNFPPHVDVFYSQTKIFAYLTRINYKRRIWRGAEQKILNGLTLRLSPGVFSMKHLQIEEGTASLQEFSLGNISIMKNVQSPQRHFYPLPRAIPGLITVWPSRLYLAGRLPPPKSAVFPTGHVHSIRWPNSGLQHSYQDLTGSRDFPRFLREFRSCGGPRLFLVYSLISPRAGQRRRGEGDFSSRWSDRGDEGRETLVRVGQTEETRGGDFSSRWSDRGDEGRETLVRVGQTEETRGGRLLRDRGDEEGDFSSRWSDRGDEGRETLVRVDRGDEGRETLVRVGQTEETREGDFSSRWSDRGDEGRETLVRVGQTEGDREETLDSRWSDRGDEGRETLVRVS
ncbi:hypothetical protein RRG08_047807 [Elysia crispata]|uniref:Uncharacterized protein n=1 Tax=Elysia crispata TaxID=231223 RepID=A0AAE1CRS3_9GAST|nr:hypothetical protein RRG08_047807 [Elysia crispata]